ncbi:PerC family transcriptional regulator [Tatumella ptyseos]|uniref:PerC family transcriptional regulator n=1 Tax=Tatumella ptyseos TaxID=82987 RepID=UPI0023F1E83B|nr:PerC family transcriptional regulator [Tatumella ptyseos]
MMKLENRIIDVIAEKHPVKSCDIYAAVGGSKIAYNRAIKALIKTGRIDRNKQHYFPAEDPATTSPGYVTHAEVAEGLEKRQLWNRAATEWLAAFDSTKSDHLRTIAARHREECLTMNKCRYYESECPLAGRINASKQIAGELV